MIKDLYLIHDSHTDIGYTNVQGRILRAYSAFMRQAITLAENDPAFRWTCETFLQVEQFWKKANEAWRSRFLILVRARQISLSANWANFTELPDENLLKSLASRSRRFADEHRLPLDTAVLADINGCSLAYARALSELRITTLLMHVNPHHGSTLMRKRIHPFWWDLGNGEKLLVYHNEHYHFGNELGLCPGAEANSSNFREPIAAFDDGILERRLPACIAGLEKAGWAHDFLIVTGSGLITDNSPPGPQVTARIARWNADAQRSPRIHLITADEVGGIISSRGANVPIYSGDWPDWWADGTGGDPEGTALFRHAQRERRWLSAAGAAFPKAAVDLEPLDTALGLYAEHTFGHSSSVGAPWNLTVHQIHVRKQGYAAEAVETADGLIDDAADTLGQGPLAYDRPLRFVVVNPYDIDLFQPVVFDLDNCEAYVQRLGQTLTLRDATTGEVLTHQEAWSLRGVAVASQIAVAARSTREVVIEPSKVELVHPSDLVESAARFNIAEVASNIHSPSIVTDHASIQWDSTGKLVSWRDQSSGRELCTAPGNAFVVSLNRSNGGAFDGISQWPARSAMVRNRQAVDAQQATAQSTRLRHVKIGPLFDIMEIEYSAPGFEFLRSLWTIHRGLPQIDVEIIGHKIGTWHPENVYCALPFTAGEAGNFWLDRGVAIRPWQDQLPGSLTDFYGVQDGLAWCGADFGVVVVMLDAHLVHCGDLQYRPRRLMGDADLPSAPDQVHAWLMNNYWETNFSAEIGGFNSFRFRVGWGPHLADPVAALRWARLATSGLRSFRRGA